MRFASPPLSLRARPPSLPPGSIEVGEASLLAIATETDLTLETLRVPADSPSHMHRALVPRADVPPSGPASRSDHLELARATRSECHNLLAVCTVAGLVTELSHAAAAGPVTELSHAATAGTVTVLSHAAAAGPVAELSHAAATVLD